MGFSLDVSIPVLTVFLQGLFSFFSPCVLPLLPLYIGYLSGGTGVRGEDGRMHYQRGKVMVHTACFVVGISFAFFLLGLGFSAIGTFFRSKQMVFARVGGILVMLFGLYQLGVFGALRVLGTERRLSLPMDKLAMSPVTALLMGFTFSFAWTPCVGPALTSVLLMAASAQTRTMGFAMIGVYTLGFVLPFLAVGLFTTSLLDFFKKHNRVVRYTVKLGGVLMVVMGLLMFTGKMNAVTGYLSQVGGGAAVERQAAEDAEENEAGVESEAADDTGSEGANEAGSEVPDEAGNETVDEAGSEGADEAGGEATDEASSEATNEAGSEAAGEESEAAAGTEASEASQPRIAALEFELNDQNGTVHTLADYEGKMIFLNFWGTWCPPCRAELPDIQKLYEAYGENSGEELVVLGVAAPLMGQEKSEEDIVAFLEEHELTYPVLMDTDWSLFNGYGIYSFPTTLMIDPEGNIYGYVSGQLSYDVMEDIVRQTKEGWNPQS